MSAPRANTGTGKILGVVGGFDELASLDRRLGRKVANFSLTTALLRYSDFDELHFFLPFSGALKPFERVYGKWLNRPGAKDRIRILPAAGLPAALERNQYLALHATEHHRFFPELCHLRNRWAKRPFPITCTPHSLNPWEGHLRNIYKVLPGPTAFDAIFCTSSAAKEYLEKGLKALADGLREMGLSRAGYAGRLEIMPLGVEAGQFGQKNQAEAQTELGLSPGPITLLCLGRLTPTDKFDLVPLLGTLKLLLEEHDARLILAGAAHEGYAESLKSAASALGLGEKVHIFQNFDSGLKPALYGAADIFVSPADNLQETFGLSILEAMAAGLPVVASDFSGYRDLVKDGETGFLIPTLGPAEFTPMDAVWPVLPSAIGALQTAQRTAVDLALMLDRLKSLAADPGLRADMGQAGRQRVLAEFNWPVVIRRMEERWTELGRMAQAQAPAAPAPDVMAASQGELFGHFFTKHISPNTRLKPGLLAPAFYQDGWAKSSHPDLAQALPPKFLARLLEFVQGDEPATLERLIQELAGELPPHAVEHLALYGLKYGVLAQD